MSTRCLLGPVLMSLKPGSQVAESYSEMSKGLGNSVDTRRSQSRPGMLQLAYIQDQLGAKDGKEDSSHMTGDDRSRTPVSNGEDIGLCSPPRTENEVLNVIVSVRVGSVLMFISCFLFNDSVCLNTVSMLFIHPLDNYTLL